MAGFFDSEVIAIPCDCGRKTEKTIAWIKANNEFTCSCGTKIVLNKSDFTGKMGEIERTIGDFQKPFKQSRK